MDRKTGIREALVQGLKQGPVLLEDMVSGIGAEELQHRRREGFWSLYEHIEHLAVTQLMLFKRLERFGKEEHPEFVPYFPDKEESKEEKKPKPVADILAGYRRWREKQVQLIEAGGDDLWSKTATHPEYEHYGFKILVRHILLHDSFHLYRMEELLLTRDEYLTEL